MYQIWILLHLELNIYFFYVSFKINLNEKHEGYVKILSIVSHVLFLFSSKNF